MQLGIRVPGPIMISFICLTIMLLQLKVGNTVVILSLSVLVPELKQSDTNPLWVVLLFNIATIKKTFSCPEV